MPVQEVSVQALDPARLEPIIGSERLAQFDAAAERTREMLAGRAVINVNSTAAGGGVAEMLQTLLAYVRGAGVDTRWIVIEGDPAFFDITKRIHNGLYGTPGDGGELGARERTAYEATARRNSDELIALVRPGDLVLVHDPQPAGLAPRLLDAGAIVVWRCHVGCDTPNDWTKRSWDFLRPYLDDVHGFVFSRRSFAPAWVHPARMAVVPPSIDPFSAKNEPMSVRNVQLALAYVGVLEGDGLPPIVPFARRDGSPGRIDRHVDLVRSGPPIPVGAPMVLQASRWDWMKDMAGVMQGFVQHVDRSLGAHLVLAGPAVKGVADDPEAALVYQDCVKQWRALPHAARGRVHLACVPMTDADEAAAIVNALQRHATVVCQKSIAEGFGLTVAEAMWKAKPVVASAVGGIVDQVVHGETGILTDDPGDLAAFGSALETLLRDAVAAEAMGRNARVRAVDRFLGDRHLEQYADLFARILNTREPTTAA
jgi:trehalose synthase